MWGVGMPCDQKWDGRQVRIVRIFTTGKKIRGWGGGRGGLGMVERNTAPSYALVFGRRLQTSPAFPTVDSRRVDTIRIVANTASPKIKKILPGHDIQILMVILTKRTKN
jgi:hypothetical protein